MSVHSAAINAAAEAAAVAAAAFPFAYPSSGRLMVSGIPVGPGDDYHTNVTRHDCR